MAVAIVLLPTGACHASAPLTTIPFLPFPLEARADEAGQCQPAVSAFQCVLRSCPI